MKLLKQETFRIQFNNHRQVPWPHHRRKTYLCYQLQLNGVTYASDYLRNKKGRHAEIRFVEKICSLKLDKDKNYNITCYLTWSPCPNCARKLVDLKRSHPHLTLRLFTSRLYYHWFQKFQEGLHLLWTSQVPVTVMGLQEFTCCWDMFVDHQGRAFELECWDGLEQRSENIQQRLNRILQSWSEEALVDDFRNLQF